MSDYAIQAENISKSYGNVHVLQGVNMEIPKSGFSAIIGKSGSGKSTLLGVISGLEKPDGGRMLVEGTDISGLDDDSLAKMRRQTLGIVFQGFNLVPSLTAIENVLLPVVFDTGDGAETLRLRAQELLEQVGIANRAHHRPSALSGGEQQRVAIARALINQPSILLADEPTGNLDESTASGILDLLLGLGRDTGATLLMVTHDMDIAAKAGMKIEMKNGKVEK